MNKNYSYGKLIGTSIAFCVRDIVSGRHKIEEVKLIIAGTDFKSPEEIIEKYKRTYWGRYPEEASKVIKKLWDEGKVIQPILEDPTAILYIKDIWYTSIDELIAVQMATERFEMAGYLVKNIK